MCMDSGPNRTQQAAHSADPRQLAAGPAGGTPPEELADPVALVSVGFRIRRWSERRIGATADQDRHRLGHQDHVDDRRVVEQTPCNPSDAAAGRQCANSRWQRRGRRRCTTVAHLIDKPDSPNRVTSAACQLSLRISNVVGPGVAGCLGNESMSARGGSLMERLWIREVRRAARRASAPFARQITLGCGAAAVGTMVASVLPPYWHGAVVQAVWAALWAVIAYIAIWTGLFMYHLWRYRSSGFRDHDWRARHDDSDPGGALFLELVRRSGGGHNPVVDLELWVKSHGNWEVVDEDEMVLMADTVIRCRFDLNHEVFAGGFYDVRWFQADDRGKLVEITRERFQLRNHSIGRRTESVSRSDPRLAPKALPISEDETSPRRAVEVR